MADDAEAFVTLDEEAGEIAGDRAEDDPRDDVHEVTSIPTRASHPPAGVFCIPKSGVVNVALDVPRADYDGLAHVTTA